MSLAHANREVEIKLRVAGVEEGRALLESHRFRIAKPRVFESNAVFDTSDQALRRAGTLLRIREMGARGLLTYKGPAAAGRHKSREELEVQFEHPEMMRLILARLGFLPVFRYEKFRTEYSDGTAIATLDETPIGVFLELEGPPPWIDATAAALGFSENDYITDSYLGLFLERCRERGDPPGDMVFAL